MRAALVCERAHWRGDRGRDAGERIAVALRERAAGGATGDVHRALGASTLQAAALAHRRAKWAFPGEG